MSYNVYAVVPPTNGRFKAMRDVWVACYDAGVKVPKDVLDFFGGNVPSPDGLIEMVESKEEPDMDSSTCIIDLKDLPEGTEIIRVSYSYQRRVSK